MRCAVVRGGKDGRIERAHYYVSVGAAIEGWLDAIKRDPCRRLVLMSKIEYEIMRAQGERLPPVPTPKWFWN